ncbi:MAG: ROK family protein [Candidatus Cloacimonadaceae bacterium]
MSIEGSKIYLGIDIGGSSVKYGWGNSAQGMLHYGQTTLTKASKKALEEIVNLILESVNKEIGLEHIAAIGVGTPGMINRQTGKLEGVNPNLSDWVDINPISIFPDELQDKITIDNDANLMTLAEAYLLPEVSHVLGITIGSGIGCGFVINKQIYHGSRGYAMELGHNTVLVNGTVCNCGRRGCLEAYASVNGLLNLIRNSESGSGSKKTSSMKDILQDGAADINMQKIIDQSIDYLAMAISNLVINLDAEAIVLGGGVMDIDDYPAHKLMKRIMENLPDLLKKSTVIKKASLGNKAGAMGAIHLAEDEFIKH